METQHDGMVWRHFNLKEMDMTQLTLEAGKEYVRRDGEVVRCMYAWKTEGGMQAVLLTKQGEHYVYHDVPAMMKTPLDLLREHREARRVTVEFDGYGLASQYTFVGSFENGETVEFVEVVK